MQALIDWQRSDVNIDEHTTTLSTYLGDANLGIISIYLQGIDGSEIIDTVHSRPAPVISATSGLAHRR